MRRSHDARLPLVLLASTVATALHSVERTAAAEPAAAAASDAAALAEALRPFWPCVSGSQERFALNGEAVVGGDRKTGEGGRTIKVRLARFAADAFDIEFTDADTAAVLRRRGDGTALALPRHRIVHLGNGPTDGSDHLDPAGLFRRLVSDDSAVAFALPMLLQPSPQLFAGTAVFFLGGRFDESRQRWQWGESTTVSFRPWDEPTGDASSSEPGFEVRTGDVRLRLALEEPGVAAAFDDWDGYEISRVPRDEIERQLSRGARRAIEILAPGPSLDDPTVEPRSVEHGSLEKVGEVRLAVLHGTPQEIGEAHGQLLATEALRCIDSVLNVVGTVETIRSGRWFRHRLEEARDRLLPHIPERHRRETRAIAAAIGCEPDLLETVNVFPELFHCSGFAVSGSATVDGSLYHGRVLDYMTEIGLQHSAVVFVVAAEGGIPFVNVGYAGFTGSVSGMNERGISLGEMGGRGEGKWDGVPMATLMRRALEECRTLDEVTDLWSRSPRTCEYYYVFADGKTRRAVGVAATPESIDLIPLGEGHSQLGNGIPDCIALSADERLKTLRGRILERHGKIDEAAALALMDRPVAMESNLHNVLFVPEELALHVAHASHGQPAAERPSVRIDFAEKLAKLPLAARSKAVPLAAEIRVDATFEAADSLVVERPDPDADARDCLAGLCWQPERFRVHVAKPWKTEDLCITFPSPRPLGNATNDTVSMEWYVTRDDDGNPQRAPACVVVHESGRGMDVGRLIARGLNAHGIHTFLIHLPWYGRRQPDGEKPAASMIVPSLSQGIGDVRRARDAVAALPVVDASRIAVQGTSLGGFVTATTAGLDHGFDAVFVLLAGGDLAGIINNGAKDAARFREELRAANIGEEQVTEVLNAVEPLRLAHRLDPSRTWLYSGTFDDVVPPRHSVRLAEAIGLEASHHLQLHADHYSGIIYLPIVLAQMHSHIKAK